ncbi:MAG: malic enzyme-like NAD(P)-binding protein [Planctomycetota bacterium]
MAQFDTSTTSDVLAGMTPAERQAIMAMGASFDSSGGTTIIEDGCTENCFYILLDGRVEVLKGDQRITLIDEPGSVLGEMSLFNDNVRTSTVATVANAKLLQIGSHEFIREVLLHNPVAIKLMQNLGRVMMTRLARRDTELINAARRNDAVAAQGAASFRTLKSRLMSDWSLRYHAIGRSGKLAITSTKPVGSAADLSIAYSPGVAEPCLRIKDDPDTAYDFTARSHLVGVITNGTAVLGLGDIGALAAKPVMEGKAVLFKQFADLDSFDIEIDEKDPDKLINIVCSLGPTFGGINLEDIKAPECFRIERECQARLDIPVFHDDQHGTAIIAAAGLLNALEIVGKKIGDVRVVFSGAGAAGFTCAKYFVTLGVKPANLTMTDIKGVVFKGREDLAEPDNYLNELALDTPHRSLAEAVAGADVFVGVSAAGVLKPDMLRSMANDPIVFALANPTPEIDYSTARETRPDVIMATGRSDHPNQVNNVIAFPYIFRGAMDARATCINPEMKLAATKAIAELARVEVHPEVLAQFPGLHFGRDYLIPKPFDRRLLPAVASAVAKAAQETGVARKKLDPHQYATRLAATIE